jgi:hypothetical protein
VFCRQLDYLVARSQERECVAVEGVRGRQALATLAQPN